MSAGGDRLWNGLLYAVFAALTLAAVSTLGDYIWARWIPTHRTWVGVVHGALLCLCIGDVLGGFLRSGAAIGRGAAGAIAVGVIAAGGFRQTNRRATAQTHFDRRGSRWIAVSLCLASIGGGCDRRVEPTPIRIGVLVNLAGAEGASTERAAKLALEAIETAGGLEVGGQRRPVELLFEDTRTAPEAAINGFRRLVQRGVVAIVGPSRSGDAIAAAGLAENSRIPMISAASTHPETTDGKRHVFRVTFTDTFQGVALARFAIEDLAVSTAAVLYDVASTYNRDLATVFQRTFEAAGGKMVAVETYVTGESDFRRQFERIRDAGPQILLLPNYDEEIPRQVRQARQMGVEAIFLGSDSWTLVSFDDLPELEGAFFSQHWHLDAAKSYPQARQFIAAFRQAFGHDPTNQAALTYDAFGLLFQAIESAGEDPDGIQQALAGIESYQGVTGAITYRGTQGDPLRRISIVQVRHGETTLYKEIEP